MCYTCGCRMPYEDHGDPANVVEGVLKRAGDTEAIDEAGVAVAKENMMDLIRLQQQAGELEDPREQY